MKERVNITLWMGNRDTMQLVSGLILFLMQGLFKFDFQSLDANVIVEEMKTYMDKIQQVVKS